MSYWYMLSPPDLDVLYASPAVRSVINQYDGAQSENDSITLYDYMHDDDRTQIQRDLQSFLKASSINGCITRCKFSWERPSLISTDDVAKVRWSEVDIVFHYVAPGLMLALLSEAYATQATVAYLFNTEEQKYINDLLEAYVNPATTPDRIFQLYDVSKMKLIACWPLNAYTLIDQFTDQENGGDGGGLLRRLTEDREAAQVLRTFSNPTTMYGSDFHRQFYWKYPSSRSNTMLECLIIPCTNIILVASQFTGIDQKMPIRYALQETQSNRSIVVPVSVSHRGRQTTGAARQSVQTHLQYSQQEVHSVHQHQQAVPSGSGDFEEKTPKKKEIKARRISTDANVPHPTRVCHSCGTRKTPMWRRGPAGPSTLCNACGVKARRASVR